MEKHRTIGLLMVVLAVFVTWVLWANTAVEVNTYEISGERVPREFDGFRIVQISDFHNGEFGEGNRDFLKLLSGTNPDILVITGDYIDSRKTRVDIALDLAGELVKLSPVYFVPGNHESRLPEAYSQLITGLENLGVTVLEDSTVQISRGEESITLVGLKDPSFRFVELEPNTETVLNRIRPDTGEYTVLLSHRPELFSHYVKAEMDLVFSGHAHGGQFRLPFVGGLFAPKQGFFPEYDAGVYEQDNTAMIVSRGIGNSVIPIRFLNRPEIVVAELRSDLAE